MIDDMISQAKSENKCSTSSLIGSSATVYGNVGPSIGAMKVILDNETISIVNHSNTAFLAS